MSSSHDASANPERPTDPPTPTSTSSPTSAAATAGGATPYSNGYVYYVLGMVFLTMIFSQIDRSIVSILVGPIKAEFGLSDTEMGFLMGPAFAVVYGVLVLPLGRFADTTGVRRNIVSGSVFLWSLFTVGAGLVTSHFQLLLMRMGVGVGEAGATAPSISLLSDYLPPEKRGRGLSVVSNGAVIGLGLGMVVGGLVEEAYGWRAALVAVGAPGILLALVYRLTIREPERGGSEGRKATESLGFAESVRGLLATRTYLYILAANGFSLFASMGRNMWEPAFLGRTYEMGTADAAIWYAITSPVPSMFGIFLGGYLVDRLGPKDKRWYLWVPGLGLGLSVPILIVFILWPETHVLTLPSLFAGTVFETMPVALIWSFVGSIVGGLFTAPFMATTQGVVPLRVRAFAAAISTLISTLIGLAGGPLLTGAIADALEPEYGRDALRYALLVPTSLPLISAVFCLFGARFVAGDLTRARRLDR